MQKYWMNTSCLKLLAIILTYWSKANVRGYPLISEVDSGAEKVCYYGGHVPCSAMYLSYVTSEGATLIRLSYPLAYENSVMECVLVTALSIS